MGRARRGRTSPRAFVILDAEVDSLRSEPGCHILLERLKTPGQIEDVVIPGVLQFQGDPKHNLNLHSNVTHR